MRGRALVLGLAVLLFGAILVHPVQAKDYPARPIEVVVGYSPGSTFDLIARVIADLAPKYLNQSMVVVNKVGAGSSIAAADVVSSNPDGYKLVLLTTVFFSTTTKTQKVPFSQDDFSPVANLTEQKLAILVNGDSPFKTLNDLLNHGKKNRGQLRWSHVGRGIISHINGLLLFRKAGVETTDIPYKGTPEQISALLGGHVDASVVTMGILKDQVRAGKIRPVVFFSDQRYNDYPDVPSAAELGFPEAAKLKVLLGCYVHKNTPEDIKQSLTAFVRKLHEDPEFKRRIQDLGDEPKFLTREAMKETIKKEEETSVPVLKEFKLYTGK
jgi:tripartite-type tricarboxylate transporter receptor subunit TctC